MSGFRSIFVPDPLARATSDDAWLEALLETERALAAVESRFGIVPSEAADAIVAACRPELYDAEDIGRRGRGAGNPVEPLVRALREQLGGEAADYVHWGATSQDILDTAAMLVSRRALELILGELEGTAAAAASLAERHARTAMVARTLLQQASPTTFGLKAAGWLDGILEARDELARVRDERLAVQLGSAVGTLAPFGERGFDVLAALADELGLACPLVPWHTQRTRIAQLSSALMLAASASAKIALDVVLLAQTEVAEVREGDGGVSSTLPHKRNPIHSVLCLASARRAAAACSLLGSGEHEHERAAGAWHAEWSALSDALAFAGGAAASVREAVEGLEVDADRMRQNLDAQDGLVLAERLSFLLAESMGRREAQALVSEAAARATANGRSLRDELATEERAALTPAELDEAFDPTGYLGSAPQLVERVLARYRSTSRTARARR